MYGDKGNSGQIMLGKCGTKHMFKSGNVDEFKVRSNELFAVEHVFLSL